MHVLLIIILVFISTEQYRYSTQRIKEFGLFRYFDLEVEENTMDQDIKNIAYIIIENDLSGEIFADNTFDKAGKAIFMLSVFAKNHGFIQISQWTECRLKQDRTYITCIVRRLHH